MNTKSLATGALLDAETFADFITRLRHDCVGKGVSEHHTADAIFHVKTTRRVTGIDMGYTDNRLVLVEDSQWTSAKDYWADCDKTDRKKLNDMAVEADFDSFLSAPEHDQWDMLESLAGHTVTGYMEELQHVSTHLTRAAAEAFIARKKHDYPLGLMVYVDSLGYAWEISAIKEGLLSGRLVLAPVAPMQKQAEEKWGMAA